MNPAGRAGPRNIAAPGIFAVVPTRIAAIVSRATTLPPIDESDPKWQAYVRQAIEEALAAPRPPIPIDEVFAQLDDPMPRI